MNSKINCEKNVQIKFSIIKQFLFFPFILSLLGRLSQKTISFSFFFFEAAKRTVSFQLLTEDDRQLSLTSMKRPQGSGEAAVSLHRGLSGPSRSLLIRLVVSGGVALSSRSVRRETER